MEYGRYVQRSDGSAEPDRTVSLYESCNVYFKRAQSALIYRNKLHDMCKTASAFTLPRMLFFIIRSKRPEFMLH